MDVWKQLQESEGFDWDLGNQLKSWLKHGVSIAECEQVFFRQPLIIIDDAKHSKTEARFYALGKTELDRVLFLVFTIRKNKIRVISARVANAKERMNYEKADS